MPKKAVFSTEINARRTCKDCGIKKSISEFPQNYRKDRAGGKYYSRYSCEPCWREKRRPGRLAWQFKNADKLKVYHSRKYEKNKSSLLAAGKRFYVKLKNIVFDHYGRVCDCCGETEERFLTIDHINNDGAQHRKTVAPGTTFFRWIINNNFPSTIRILCFNCNSGRYHNGGICPHEERHADIVPLAFKKQKEG